jgi:cysteinyl-tRNA synthetase
MADDCDRRLIQALRLYNTLSGKIEEFHPLENNEVRMYACGPTVYDYGHIGNFRTLSRWTFCAASCVQDWIQGAPCHEHHRRGRQNHPQLLPGRPERQGLHREIRESFSRRQCHAEYRAAGLVRATDHIEEMARFVAALVKKGFAYRTDDGSYYFRIAKFPGYGKLSKKDFEGMEDGARVDVDEY